MFSYNILNNIIIFNFIGNITIDNFKEYCKIINNMYNIKKDMYLIYNLKEAKKKELNSKETSLEHNMSIINKIYLYTS